MRHITFQVDAETDALLTRLLNACNVDTRAQLYQHALEVIRLHIDAELIGQAIHLTHPSKPHHSQQIVLPFAVFVPFDHDTRGSFE